MRVCSVLPAFLGDFAYCVSELLYEQAISKLLDRSHGGNSGQSLFHELIMCILHDWIVVSPEILLDNANSTLRVFGCYCTVNSNPAVGHCHIKHDYNGTCEINMTMGSNYQGYARSCETTTVQCFLFQPVGWPRISWEEIFVRLKKVAKHTERRWKHNGETY